VAGKTFGKSEIVRTEPDIGKEPIIEVRDAPSEAVARQPTHPSRPKPRQS
jgi:hypothetical protein